MRGRLLARRYDAPAVFAERGGAHALKFRIAVDDELHVAVLADEIVEYSYAEVGQPGDHAIAVTDPHLARRLPGESLSGLLLEKAVEGIVHRRAVGAVEVHERTVGWVDPQHEMAAGYRAVRVEREVSVLAAAEDEDLGLVELERPAGGGALGYLKPHPHAAPSPGNTRTMCSLVPRTCASSSPISGQGDGKVGSVICR
jgi:hypothetical protein